MGKRTHVEHAELLELGKMLLLLLRRYEVKSNFLPPAKTGKVKDVGLAQAS